MVSVSYRSSSKHCVGESNYHFQFTPKYRRDIFRDSVLKNACLVSFRGIAAKHEVRLLAVEFGPEHVHLFMGGCRKYSVSQLAQYFKGGTFQGVEDESLGPCSEKRVGQCTMERWILL